MQFLDLIQGSEEWLRLRRTKVTATDCAAILGISRYKSPLMVWTEKKNHCETEMNEAMRRGQELEPIAREYFSNKHGRIYTPCVVLSDDRPWQMASLDGYNREDCVVLEIKCPGEDVFSRVKGGEEPLEYIYQCLHQLSVSDQADYAILAFYMQREDGRIDTYEKIIDRDEKKIQEINEKEERFYLQNMIGWNEPELSRLDYNVREDQEWASKSALWAEAKIQKSFWEQKEADYKKVLIDLARGHSTRGAGVQATKYFFPGVVDYDAIPEMKGVDKNQYRGPTMIRWRISSIKD